MTTASFSRDLTSEPAAAEDSIGRIVPFSGVAADGVVTTRSGDFVSTWQVTGLPFEGLSPSDAYAKMAALNLLVRSLSNGRFAFWVHRVRRAVTDELQLPPDGFARAFMEKYHRALASGGLVVTEIFLTVVYRPTPQRAGWPRRMARSAEEISAGYVAAIEALENVGRQIDSTMSDYGPRRLKHYTHAGRTYSQQLEFYNYLVSSHWWRVPVKDIPIHRYIGISRVLFGNELVETRDTYGSTYSAFVDLKDYADYTEPGILNSLIGLPCEYIETQSFNPYTAPDAKAALKRQRNQLSSSEDSSRSQIAQMDEALDRVASGDFSFGEYHYSLQVRASTPDGARKARSQAIEALQSAGFLGVGIDLVTAQAFAAQLPGNWQARPRVARLSSRNFCGLCAMHNFGSGKRNGNPWGEAVAILKSPALQPVYFNFHASDPGVDAFGKPELGNTQIIGKSRSGKTVLALTLMANLLKYGTQLVYFDKDRGAEIAIRAFGGEYLVLQRGAPTDLNPFKLEPTPANILFWVDLVTFCSARSDHAHTPKDEDEIGRAVNAVARMPAAMRGFAAVIQNLPDTDPNGVAQRLRKWAAGGLHGWALDCPEDGLRFELGRPYGLDYTEILEDPATCPAIMMYLMYRVEQLIDGRRFAFFMDEYWKALQVRYFENFAKNKQKTIGKQNGFGVYMTQSPSDTLASPIAKALIEQTATFIFLPNPTADYDDYVNGFKLTPTEFELVRTLPEASRMFLIKQGHQVSVAMLDLRGFDQELTVLSGTTHNVARLDALRARLGDSVGHWLPAYLQGQS